MSIVYRHGTVKFSDGSEITVVDISGLTPQDIQRVRNLYKGETRVVFVKDNMIEASPTFEAIEIKLPETSQFITVEIPVTD
jgi:hypothetical protein